jgi:hypothetical protein
MRLIDILSAARGVARMRERSAHTPEGDCMSPVFSVRASVFSHDDASGCGIPVAAARSRVKRATMLILLTVVLAVTTICLNRSLAPLCGRVPDFPCGP